MADDSSDKAARRSPAGGPRASGQRARSQPAAERSGARQASTKQAPARGAPGGKPAGRPAVGAAGGHEIVPHGLSRAEVKELAAVVASAIREARGDRTQDWLGTEVARIEKRSEAYGQNTVAGWEAGKHALKPAKVFTIERALGVPAGSISRIAGYIPVDSQPSRTVPEAIECDNDLTADQREDLLAQYHGMVARTRARRDKRRH